MSQTSSFKESASAASGFTASGSRTPLTTSSWTTAESRNRTERRRVYMMASFFLLLLLVSLVLMLFKIRESASAEGSQEDTLTHTVPITMTIPSGDATSEESTTTAQTTRTVATTTRATTTRMSTRTTLTTTMTPLMTTRITFATTRTSASTTLTTTRTPLVTMTTPLTKTKRTATATMTTRTTRKPMNYTPNLLCTFGLATNSSTIFPPDGLCEFFFFDSAYREGLNKPRDPDTVQDNLNTFLAKVTEYKKTEFGVGFSSEFYGEVEEDLNRTDTALLSYFWQRGVFHFGVIDIPVLNTGVETLSRVFMILRALGALAEQPKNVGRTSYVVMGTVPLDIMAISERMSNIYHPDLFIGHGHYPYLDQSRPGCLIMPPTTILRENSTNRDYPYDLGTTVQGMQKIGNHGATPQWMLSVTMKGRWATALSPGPEPHFGEACIYQDTSGAFSSYAEICSHGDYSTRLKYDNRYDAMYLVNGSMLLSYDNEVSFCRKLCSVKAKNIDLRFGIAAYDLEYDDYRGNCLAQNRFLQGYSRLMALRRIVDYFKTFTREDMENGCLELFPSYSADHLHASLRFNGES